ncbi:hypothetical protein AB0C77_12655 [Streptomyces sp. NPDC048629]|uniref:hypothetical protein n=1 Tax=Streptomyces sp. NPDC048629 TaxID=3154824 RepID=UPI003428AEDC
MKRLAALLLALTAALCMVSAPPAAADSIVGNGIDFACEATTGPVLGAIADAIAGEDLCDKIGDTGGKKVEEEWNNVWNSVLGDAIKSGEDAAKWILRKSLTTALDGPSLRLEDTGLFGEKATLAGMLVWLGWVIAAFGLMWQLGKMAVTGQMKYAGQALIGWVQNALLTGIGLTIISSLLFLGDEMASGLVEQTFGDDGKAISRIVQVMLPASVLNPGIAIGVVTALVFIGFLQMMMIYLRESAIPIQCLLLPIAGAGRIGGEATRQWAPRLVTSILVIIAYKPLLAIIICVGFAEFGHAQTLSEWLRGLATLTLGVIAPGPLMKLFAPFGAEIGAGFSAGGALGAAANIGSSVMSGGSGGGSGGGGSSGGGGGGKGPNGPDRDPDPQGPDPVQHAQYVNTTMGPQNGKDTPEGKVPRQADSPDRGPAPAEATKGMVSDGPVKGEAAAAAGPVGMTIEVMDGVNNAIQKGSDEMGGGKQ